MRVALEITGLGADGVVLAAFQRWLQPRQQLHEDIRRRQPGGSCRDELDCGGTHGD